MEKEQFQWIKGFEGIYKVSSFGRVISVERKDRFNRQVGGELKQAQVKGYCFVTLFKDGKGIQRYVHRLVAEAFLPNPENKPCVDHIDTDKSNNHASNLRWATYKENMNNTLTREWMTDNPIDKNKKRGINNPFSVRVAMYDMNMKFICTFDSLSAAARGIGVNDSSVRKVCIGERQHTHGWVFRYVETEHLVIPKCERVYKGKPVIQMDMEGNFIAEYESAKVAGEKLGIYAANISKACNGVKDSYKGYRWRFKET